jgi:hypothetical protein
LWQGGILSKKDLVENIRTEAFEDSPEMSDTMFRQIGDAAIFSYVFRRTLRKNPTRPFTNISGERWFISTRQPAGK